MGFAITDLGTDIQIVYTDPASKTTSWILNKSELSVIKYIESMDRFKMVASSEFVFFSFSEVTSPVAVDGAALLALLTAMKTTGVTQSQTFTATARQTVFNTTINITTIANNLFVVVNGATYLASDAALGGSRTGANQVTFTVPFNENDTVTILSLS